MPAGRGAESLFAGPGETRARLRETDWGATALGPVETWSEELRAAVRTVLPSRVPMLLWWGPELAQLYNDAYTPVLGDKHPAAIGEPAAQCWPEVWDVLSPLVRDVLDGRGATFGEEQMLLLNRHGYLEQTYWTFSYSPIETEGGTVAGIFVATTDVTARVLTRRRMRTLRKLGTLSVADAEDAADTCRAALAIMDRNRGDIPFAVTCLRQTDNDAGELRQVAAFGTSGPTPLADDRRLLGRVLDSGEAELVTGIARRYPDSFTDTVAPDAAMALPLHISGHPGPIGVLILGVNPYRAPDEEYRTFFGLVARQVSTALTDGQALTAQRRRAHALAELDAAKTRFFQNISHEFRTPITLLLGPLETLLTQYSHRLPVDQVEAMRAAHRAALRLRRLVDTLLTLTRAEADQLHARPEPTDLATLTTDCVSMFRSAAERAGLRLQTQVALSRPVAVDREMWANIVLNLLSNAVKYTPTGTISVGLHDLGDRVVLTVSDTGVGIPDDELPHVFDRFHRVATGHGRSSEGTGIGLSLVTDLVTALGGEVTVTSTPAVGSTFTVTLPAPEHPAPTPRPLDPVDVVAAQPFVQEARLWEPVATQDPTQPAADPQIVTASVLLVEDNPDLRAYLGRLLRDQGWAVTTVGDGASALSSAAATRPDLVLTDVMLPGMDGIALLRALRADPGLSRVPVILLTARAGPESAVDGLRHGADDYVVKPFHPAELVARIRVHLELSQVRELLISAERHETLQLRGALDSRATIGQAVGLIMARNSCDADTAFQALADQSQRRNVKLRDLAREFVQQANRATRTGAYQQVDSRPGS